MATTVPDCEIERRVSENFADLAVLIVFRVDCPVLNFHWPVHNAAQFCHFIPRPFGVSAVFCQNDSRVFYDAPPSYRDDGGVSLEH